jgi:hypothetical protein
MLRKFTVLAIMVGGLSACVAGQSIKLAYAPPAPTAASNSSAVTVLVVDQRNYVTSGDKKPFYLGHYRGGFGNTFDVTNYQKVPLADQMKSDLGGELSSLGFASAAGGKQLKVIITEWNFDTMVNGKVWYAVTVSVADASGTVLAQSTVKDQKTVDGNLLTGAKGAMEDEVPQIYAQMIRATVRENPSILAALKR